MKSIVAFWILFGMFLLGAGPLSSQTQSEILLERRSTGKGYAICGSCTVPKILTSIGELASRDEPGERIVITGTIYKIDGVTPDSGVILFLYQADAGGYYHRPSEDVFHPRLHAWLKTGNDGKYEIRTVKPMPEVLARTEPAHIHVHVFGNGIPEHFLHDFWFNGDGNISRDDASRLVALGRYCPIMTLRRGPDGLMRGSRDFRIKPAKAWEDTD